MAKTEKYSSIISIKADADFEQLINSIKKVQSNLQANPHTKSQDFLGIDQSLNKIAQLQEKMRLLREQGFSSPKDVQTYQRAMQDLLNEANEVQASFKNIHFKGLDREINEVEKALKKAQTTITSVQNSLKKTASQGLSKILNKTEASNYVAQLQQAGTDADKISQIYSEINNKLDEQINKQKDLKTTQQEIINQAKSGIKTTFNQKSFITNDNFDASKGAITSQAKTVFNAFLPSVADADSATDALNKFKIKLEEIGLIFTKNSVFNSTNINKNPLLGIFEALRSSGGATNLAEATAKLIEVDSVLANLNGKKNLLKELFEGANFTGLIDQLQKGIISEQQFKEQLEQLTQLKINQTLTPDILQVNQELSKSKQNAENFSNSLTSMSQSQLQFDKLTTTIGNSVKRLLSFTTAWQTLRRVLRSTFNDIKALDKAFGSIAMVTNYSVSDMWQQYGTYAEMANKLGQTTQSVIEASGLYYQQGLETVEVMSLTEETMKLATLAGLDFKEATSQMTAALRAFHMEMNQGAHVTDVYATLAASAAVDVQGISEAMSATASIAHSAGMSFENTAAMLTTMVEATQEAPKNLGTAMKAIIARFTELKNSVAGTDQSEFADLDYNKVDKALKSVGISIKDATGQFRNLDEVFLELSGKWNSLDRNTQRYIATIAAGSRQQSRFIALMENYDRTMDLIETAQDSAGKADKQFAKYSDTIEFKLNRLKNAWEQTKTTIFNSEFYGDVLDIATKVVEKLEGLDWKRLLVAAPAAIAAGRLMGKIWADNFTQGAGMIRNLFGAQGVGKNKGLTARELQTNYREGKSNFLKKYGIKYRKEGNYDTYADELISKDKKLVEEQEKLENKLSQAQERGNNKQIEKINKRIELNQKEQKDNEKAMQEFDKAGKETYLTLNQQRANLWKKQAWSSAASAAGMAAGTALTMAMMGTFDASQIAKTIAIQTATTAVSQFASGNWVGGIISGVIGAASFGLGKLFDYLEKEEEKYKLATNQVYAHEKAIEKLEEKQETLNQDLDKQNAIYDETKEKYDSFKSASETYEELSTKIALTDEEQEKLNEATQELANMHPELIQGYDDQGNAILSMGDAWNKAAEAEKAYWNQVRKDQNDAEIKSIENEYQLAKEYQGKDRSLKLQRKELFSGRETIAVSVFPDIQYKNINDLLNMETWDESYRNSERDDDAERYVEELIKNNSAFAEIFVEAYNKVMDANIKSAQAAYDKMFEGDAEEENARWAEMVEYIKEQFSLWEELDGIDLTEGTKKTTEALKKASDSTLNSIDILIGDSIENEDAKKQLLNQLRKSAISDEEIEKALEDGVSGIDDFAEKIVNDNQDLINQYKNVTPYQSQLIGEFFGNLNTVTIEESQKAINEIKSSGVGEDIIKGLEESLGDAINDSTGFTNQLKEYFGKGFEDSGISKIFEQLGISGKNAFIKRLAQFDNNDARVYSHAINDFIESNINIDPKVTQALMGIDWSNLSAIDIITERKNFAKLGEEWDIPTQKMNDYFDQFKNNVASVGVLDITSTALSTDALSDVINEDLKEIVAQSSKISTTIKEQLTNGFLDFSQSQDLREACEKIGLNANDYLKQNEAGLTMLDTEAMKKALEEQVLDENQILDELKAQYQEKINQIDAQIAIIKGNDEEFNQLAKNIKLSGELANNYRAAAAAAYALAHDSVEFDFDTKDIVFDIDTTQVKHDAIDELLKIRDEYEKFIDENLTPESDWWQSMKGNFSSATYEIEKNIATAIKEGTLAESDLETAEKERDDAVAALAKSTQDLEQKERALIKAEKELKEAYNGNPLHKNKLDPLNNYTTMLDEVASKAEKAKNKLDNLSRTDNVGQLLQTYTTEIHSEVVVRNAQSDVIKQAMANAEATLSEYSEYWYKIGEQYYINYDKLNAAAMPDDLSDEIENQIDQLRNWRKELENNNDAIDKLRKDFEETQKQALQNYVNLEKEVVETLKEQYQKEVDDLQDKYSAMKDADDDYLNALEKAINKERDLRNRQNQWDDLAKKEKKLSLMQRDTSGSQQVEALKLQQEVEKDRTQLLDDSVDDIVDSLKEMYELQQESRDVEIEYMNSMLENANLITEANAIISGWTTAEDAVNWFLNAKDLTQISTAELELEKKSWEELYNAKKVYDEQSKIDFNKYLEATQSEINEYVQQLSETATTESERAITEIKEKIIEAQQAAEDAYKSAQQNLTDAQDAWDKAKKAAETAQAYFELLKQGLEQAGVVGNSDDDSNKNLKPTNTSTTGQQTIRNNFSSNSEAISYSNQIAGEARAAAYTREINSSSKGDYSLKTSSTSINNMADYYKQQGEEKLRKQEDQTLRTQAIAYLHKTGIVNYDDTFQGGGVKSPELIKIFKEKGGKYLADIIRDISIDWPENGEIYIGATDKLISISRLRGSNAIKDAKKYAQGGLVDYTGPAWVDGSPSNPEAFLSVDDTRLIGNLVNLLSNIPSLNPNTNPTQFSTSNIGDTTINLTVNFDSVSEDYDADRVIDLMKEKIVEAANYTGANVILNKR